MPDETVVNWIREKYTAIEADLDERARRRWAGAEARSLGWGGIAAVALATGLSDRTVRNGIRELDDPHSAATSNGAEVTIGSDNQVIVEDLDTSVATYTITAETQLVAITGIRLDVCQDPSLPFNGPGLQNTNGNFHLAEVSLSVDTL